MVFVLSAIFIGKWFKKRKDRKIRKHVEAMCQPEY